MQRQIEQADSASQPGKSAFMFFGMGQFSRSIIWSVTDLLIGYHLVERVGLSGIVAGAILFGTIMFSALPDVFVATWIGRRSDPASFALRLQAVFGIASLISALLLFGPTPPGTDTQIIYLCAVSAAFRISYAIYDVSQNALISLLPQQRAQVRNYVTNKILMTSIGRLAASGLVFMALTAPNDALADLKAISYAIVPVLISAWGLSRLAAPRRVEKTAPVAFKWRSLPWSRLAIPMLATAFQVGLLQIIARLLPLYGSSQPGYADNSSLVVLFVCGTIAGPLLANARNWPIAKFFPLPLALSAGATAAAIALLYPHGAAGCLALAFIYGAAISGLTNLVWERMALIAADHAIATGVRIDAPAFALLTTSIKLALAISTGLFGALLDGFMDGNDTSFALIVSVIVLGGMGTALVLAIDDANGQVGMSRLFGLAGRRALRAIFAKGTSS